LGSVPSLREFTVCHQTLAGFRRRCLLLAPKFDSPALVLLTGFLGLACLQAA
jgi:hypothetical protein